MDVYTIQLLFKLGIIGTAFYNKQHDAVNQCEIVLGTILNDATRCRAKAGPEWPYQQRSMPDSKPVEIDGKCSERSCGTAFFIRRYVTDYSAKNIVSVVHFHQKVDHSNIANQ